MCVCSRDVWLHMPGQWKTEARDHVAACPILHGRQDLGVALDLQVAANPWDGGDRAAFRINIGDCCSSQGPWCEGKGSR
jgi:hypothetical protein